MPAILVRPLCAAEREFCLVLVEWALLRARSTREIKGDALDFCFPLAAQASESLSTKRCARVDQCSK